MQIMVDANIVYSAMWKSSSLTAEVLRHIKKNHTLVMSKYTLAEVDSVFYEKRYNDYDSLIQDLYNLPDIIFHCDLKDLDKYPFIKDVDDIPVLAYAMEAEVDILITGDNDFDIVRILKPKIMKPREYREIFMMN